MANTFKALLRRLQRRHYPSVRAFADALGIDASRISRGQPFDLRGCLKLALLTGEPPSVILRAGGKADLAALIESLYGASPPALSAEQQELLAAFAQIPQARSRRDLINIAWAVARVPGGRLGNDPGEDDDSGPVPVKEPPHEMRSLPADILRRARAGG